jgi:nucleotide-binding universal stress UspA family protein
LDGSPLAEQALPVAMDLADDLGVRIHLVRALETEKLRSVIRLSPSAAASYAASVSSLRSVATEYLEEQAKRVRSRDIPVSIQVVEGSPAEELCQLARPGDIIVMTTRGRGGLQRWLLGSVTERVVREAPVPVLVVRASHVP